jgi:hypothetical protein
MSIDGRIQHIERSPDDLFVAVKLENCVKYNCE